MITINIPKAKEIAHDIRRSTRAEEFSPHDEVIMKQIPGNDYTQAEAARAAIRTKYSEMQAAIDSAETIEEIKSVLP